MPRIHRNALTSQYIRRLRQPGAYTDGLGLTLRVDDKGNKRWILRLTVRGRRRNMGLGSWPAVPLQEAREQALEYAKEARAGRDPIAGRRLERVNRAMPALPTFQEAARQVIALRSPSWTSDTSTAWEESLARHVYPLIGDMMVSHITSADVLRVLAPMWHTTAPTARRIRQRMVLIFDYCVVSGWAHANPVAAVDKALPRQNGKRKHHLALPYERVPAFLQALRGVNADDATKLALEFQVLTAVRPGEARGAWWSEMDLKERVWTIPESRMKAKREHTVPLSGRALEVLEEARKLGVHQGQGYVFPSPKWGRTRPLSDMAVYNLARRVSASTTIHGFRSSFRDWTLEQTSFPWAVAEAALAHQLGNATEAAYARSDLFSQRRAMMEAWALYCEQGAVSPGVAPEAAPLEGHVCVVCGKDIHPERLIALGPRTVTCSPKCSEANAEAQRRRGVRLSSRRKRTGEPPQRPPGAQHTGRCQHCGHYARAYSEAEWRAMMRRPCAGCRAVDW